MNPKILVLDIETSPMTAYVWGRRDVQIGLNQVVKEWSVIAWAAKWLGDPPSKIMYRDVRNEKDVLNDGKILLDMWHLLDTADIIITQNGKSFDSPKLNARFIMNGMNPPSPYKHLDTYRIARNIASFTSNKLEYLTEKLCTKYKKLTHSKYPGMELWKACLAGDLKAWKEMERYNKHDVLATEELYMKLRAWTPASMPNAHFLSKKAMNCGVCGSYYMHRKGIEVSKKGSYQKYQCRECGKWTQGDKIK